MLVKYSRLQCRENSDSSSLLILSTHPRRHRFHFHLSPYYLSHYAAPPDIVTNSCRLRRRNDSESSQVKNLNDYEISIFSDGFKLRRTNSQSNIASRSQPWIVALVIKYVRCRSVIDGVVVLQARRSVYQQKNISENTRNVKNTILLCRIER